MADSIRKVYHVTCRPHRVQEHLCCWDVKAEDEPEALSSHWTRDEAAFEAARLAMTLLTEEGDPAQVVIHGDADTAERVVVYSHRGAAAAAG
jgi:hypothetical protein